ncbi:MAG: hypothetical protein JRI68_22485, partial [Deltaproteobacteria bacterium]|nr:hypothetical protein [Deltaproteobacteria bacterium]
MSPPSPPHVALPGVGLEIGSVSVKWASADAQGATDHEVSLHGGAPRKVVERWLARWGTSEPTRVVITGQAAQVLLDLPYRSTAECLERALAAHELQPDLLLSLGGESFRAYPMRGGRIRNVIATSKCAAGTGEFIVQQFQRMGMTLAEGLEQSRQGRRVPLATRCSVHCKSDATHMLNKGECTPGDIAASLIGDLAQRASELARSAEWPLGTVVLAGGVTRNPVFVDHLDRLLPDSRIVVLPESSFLEAHGACLHARELPAEAARPLTASVFSEEPTTFETLPPLSAAEALLDFRVTPDGASESIADGGRYLLGVDAGSTTTKAVLLDAEDGTVAASCYLRTLGNPIVATRQCLEQLGAQVGDRSVRIAGLATTGSGREMVSVFLDNCHSVNEIVAHARAAAHYLPEVSTVFEIGGQDSKFVSFLDGVPVDYAMNEGCSAGTGSFLEESASLDMNVGVKDISAVAMGSPRPIAFGERCAAFINTDLRNALQQGASQADVVAGLVYSIADNYISRVVGPRPLGDHLLFLGGVALNRAVALAVAARTQQPVVVPPHPELMGCIGAAFEARDRLTEGTADEGTFRLAELATGEMKVTGTFRCKACDNHCELKTITVGGRAYPFGGLCPKYELQRRGKGDVVEGRDLVAWRNQLMFDEYGPRPLTQPRGRIGLPLALTTFELYPLYARLINELGYDVVASGKPTGGSSRTEATMCYPCQVTQRAVEDLLDEGVDFVLLPRVIELEIPDGALHSYTCPSTSVIPDIIRAALPEQGRRVLSPHIGLSPHLVDTTLLEIERLGTPLGLEPSAARAAGQRALDHYQDFRAAYRERGDEALRAIAGEPAVVVAGRPYSVYAPEVNLALPRKIVGRGFHAIPADLVRPPPAEREPRDVWHFTQQVSDAIDYVGRHDEAHLCLVSCFSCGPDSVMVHDYRRRLAGSAFCYLEIDSHTAHAGFETRVGAFLDIVEKRARQAKQGGESVDRAPPFTPAKLAAELDHLIDSDGQAVAYDDPRVVHVLTDVTSPFAGRLIEAVYAKNGRRCRTPGRTRPATLERAKGLCSGRECIPLIATVGAALTDLEQARESDELTLYLTLDQEGPCQNGAWPLAWQVFIERLAARNVISGVNRSSANRQLGLNGAQVAEIGRCVLAG